LYDRTVSALYERECAAFVYGYQLLWSQNETHPNSFNFTKAEDFADFVSKAKAKAVGDKAIWDAFTPSFPANRSRASINMTCAISAGTGRNSGLFRTATIFSQNLSGRRSRRADGSAESLGG
jgi:GH35 family endo-1,4-beta-xylanase